MPRVIQLSFIVVKLANSVKISQIMSSQQQKKSVKTVKMAERRSSYTTAFKLHVIKSADRSDTSKAAGNTR